MTQFNLLFLEKLKNKKNLLGFSGGADSSALFKLLIDSNIEFDIAIIDYGIRESSKIEVDSAKNLASKFNKLCFVKQAPKFSKNFEANARNFRYEFFREIIEKFNYENLILGHNLNDRLEWFFMMLGNGAGFSELIGLNGESKFYDIKIFRPLINIKKSEIVKFCIENNIEYFEDETNKDLTYKRNYIRHTFSDKFLDKFSEGVIKSFDFMNREKEQFYNIEYEKINNNLFRFYASNNLVNLKTISIILKKMGYVLNINQRRQIEKNNFIFNINAGNLGEFSISKMNEFIYVFKNIKLDSKYTKEFKEFARTNKIPLNLRATLFIYSQNLNDLKMLLKLK